MNKTLLKEEASSINERLFTLMDTDFFTTFFGLFATSRISKESFADWLRDVDSSKEMVSYIFNDDKNALNSFLDHCLFLKNELPKTDGIKYIISYFYEWLLMRQQVHYTLVYSDFTHTTFIDSMNNIIESELKHYQANTSPEQYKLEARFLSNILKQCQDPVVFQYLKETYIRTVLRAPFTIEILALTNEISYDGLVKQAVNINESLPEQDRFTLEDITDGFTFLKQTEGLKLLKDTLHYKETQGFLAFQAYCKEIKQLLLNISKSQISIQQYVHLKDFPLTGPGFEMSMKYYNELSAAKLSRMYLEAHKNNWERITGFILSASLLLDGPGKSELTKKVDMDQYYSPVYNLLIKYIELNTKQLNGLFDKVNHILESYNRSKKSDGFRAFISGLLGGGLFTLAKITYEELTIDDKVKAAISEAHSQFKYYLSRDLKKIEHVIGLFYESYLNNLIDQVIIPYAKDAFLNRGVVRKERGLDNYIEQINGYIDVMKEECNSYTPIKVGKTDNTAIEKSEFIDQQAYRTYNAKWQTKTKQ